MSSSDTVKMVEALSSVPLSSLHSEWDRRGEFESGLDGKESARPGTKLFKPFKLFELFELLVLFGHVEAVTRKSGVERRKRA